LNIPYRTKEKWIGKFVAGKNVLDLGCVCHELDKGDRPWLHGFICKHAESVLGVDYLPDEVVKMQERGYRAICENVEEMNIGKTFDVVVAGDILEHLSNLGRFFERVQAHLKPGGLLLVTTPNPLTFVRFVRVLLKGKEGANREHTCWFTSKVLRQLAQRYGFSVAEEAYLDDIRLSYTLFPRIPTHGGVVRRTFRRFYKFSGRLLWQPAVLTNSLLCLVRPQLAETLCMAFTYEEKP